MPTSSLRREPHQLSKYLATLSEDQLKAIQYDWRFHARSDQLPPTDREWTYWLLLGGRGSGKTRVISEMAKKWALEGVRNMMIVARTYADVRDIVIDGESGILAVSPPWFMPRIRRRYIVWPNGVKGFFRSAEQPNSLRGPQFEKLIADEWCAWKQPKPQPNDETPVSAWDNALMGMRLGDRPQAVIATTPKPIKALRKLINNPETVVSRSRTYDNLANLAPTFQKSVIAQFEGTRTGRQELDAEILDKPEGALWTIDMLSRCRLPRLERRPQQIVLAIDPSGAAGVHDVRSDEIGIVACCDFGNGEFGVLGDYSLRAGPKDWANHAAKIVDAWGVDVIIAESNFGGALVKAVIEASGIGVPVRMVHATRGKHIRAAPISLLYEQGRVWHVGPPDLYSKLEDQMTDFTAAGYTGSDSPDRADALVWGISALALGAGGGSVASGGTRS